VILEINTNLVVFDKSKQH